MNVAVREAEAVSDGDMDVKRDAIAHRTHLRLSAWARRAEASACATGVAAGARDGRKPKPCVLITSPSLRARSSQTATRGQTGAAASWHIGSSCCNSLPFVRPCCRTFSAGRRHAGVRISIPGRRCRAATSATGPDPAHAPRAGSGIKLPYESVQEAIGLAINLVVHLDLDLETGQRRVGQVMGVRKYDRATKQFVTASLYCLP
jgi:hypothetical protein